MAAISAVTAKKLAAINGNFLALPEGERLEFVQALRASRRKPTVTIKVKALKVPKAATAKKTRKKTEAGLRRGS